MGSAFSPKLDNWFAAHVICPENKVILARLGLHKQWKVKPSCS